jgi:hypothetical protein
MMWSGQRQLKQSPTRSTGTSHCGGRGGEGWCMTHHHFLHLVTVFQPPRSSDG